MAKRYTAANESLRDWLWAELSQRHQGAANAITLAELARRARAAGFIITAEERNLREEIQALRLEDSDRALICSSSRPPYGLYVPRDPVECRSFAAETLSRMGSLREIHESLERAARRKWKSQATQLTLFDRL